MFIAYLAKKLTFARAGPGQTRQPSADFPMTPEPRKTFPLPRILNALCAGAGWIWGASEHNRAEKLHKKLSAYEPPHDLPCWTERIEAQDPQQSRREYYRSVPSVPSVWLIFLFSHKC
jgi:hypothetical protein